MFSSLSIRGTTSSQYAKADGNADKGSKILDTAAEETSGKGG